MKDIVKVGGSVTLAFLLVGCGGPADGVRSAGSLDRPAGAATAAVQPTLAGRPYLGKPRPPVWVTLAPGATLEAGVPAALSLLVRSGVPVSGLQIAVDGDAGLAISDVPGTAGARYLSGNGGTWYPSNDISSLAVGDALSVRVLVTPTSGGTRYLSGLVSFEVNGVRQGATFSVPVRVGGAVTVPPVASKPQRPAFRDASGELIDSMPAETTVR